MMLRVRMCRTDLSGAVTLPPYFPCCLILWHLS